MKQFGNNFDSITGTPTTTTTSTSTTNNSRRSSSTSSSIHTVPGVFCNADDLQAIKEAYQGCIGCNISVTIAHYIENLLANGMQPEVILNAIQETGWARRPSPQYMRAILERYRSRGIKSMEQLLYDQDEFAERKHWWED